MAQCGWEEELLRRGRRMTRCRHVVVRPGGPIVFKSCEYCHGRNEFYVSWGSRRVGSVGGELDVLFYVLRKHNEAFLYVII